MRTDILGVGFDNRTLAETVEAAAQAVEQGGFHYAVTPNPEFVLLARKDAAFRALLNRADFVVPDGIGVVYAAKLLGRPLKGKVPGIDFAAGLMAWMGENGKRLFLLGAKPGVAEAAGEALKQRYPGLVLCGTHDGYFQQDGPVAALVRQSGADVVFVCLGAPKQEQWMAQNGPGTGAKLMVGLGGSLDVFAGIVQRAPERWQRMGLEWLYRLLKEPKRLGRMAKLPLFLLAAVGERMRGK